MRPDGTSKTVSYSANPQVGFQAVPFGQLGVELPPFPERLNTGKNQVEKEEDEDFVVVDRGMQIFSDRLRKCLVMGDFSNRSPILQQRRRLPLAVCLHPRRQAGGGRLPSHPHAHGQGRRGPKGIDKQKQIDYISIDLLFSILI